MVIITNLDGKSLPLIDIDFLSRTRGTNGDYQITLSVRRTKRNAEAFKLIEDESLITLKDGNKFRVKNIDKETVNNVSSIEVTAAQHSFYDAVDNFQYKIIEKEKVLSLHEALTHALEGTDITFYIEDDFDKYSFENFGDDTSIALFKKAQENFEFEFDVENNTHLRIYKQLGSKTKGIQMRWKQNIATIKQSISTQNLSTYIKGYGKPKEDADGNVIEGKYEVEMDYTSPNAKKYGIRHATPYSNEKIKDEATMLRYLKNNLIDYPEMTFEITYENLKDNININLDDVELGDVVYLIHEPLNLNFNTRILEVTDYPLHPQLKPIYTISSQPLDKLDKQTANTIDKNSLEKELVESNKNQSALSKRIEGAIEAVYDVENAMEDVDKEMERIENEVLPEIEQAVDSTKIPHQVEPPYPIPTSKLWMDTSVNPPVLKIWDEESETWEMLGVSKEELAEITEKVQEAIDNTMIPSQDEAPENDELPKSKLWWNTSVEPARLMRWNGTEWVVLSLNEDEIDDLMQQMREDAVTESKEYSEAEIKATRQAIINQLNEEIESLQIGGRNLLKDSNNILGSEHWNLVNLTFHPQQDNKFVFSESGESYIEYQIDNSVSLSSQLVFSAKLNIASNKKAEIWIVYPFNGVEEVIYTDIITREDKNDSDRYIVKIPPKKRTGNNYKLRVGYTKDSAINEAERISSMYYWDIDTMQPQLEKGNKPTDWSPAPEDITERITKTETDIKVNTEEIKLKASQSSVDSKVDTAEYTEKVGEITTSIDGITQRVQKAETNVDKNTNEISSARSQIAKVDTKVDGITSTVSDISSDLTTAQKDITKVEQTAGKIESTVSSVKTELDDMEIGGRNLLEDSGTPISSASYAIHDYYLTDAPDDNETVTIVMKADLAPTKSHFYLYNSGGQVSIPNTRFDHDNGVGEDGNIYVITTNWRIRTTGNTSTNKFLRVYHMASSDTGTSKIHWIKLVRGSKTSLDWSPAPEDMDARMTATETTIKQLPSEIDLAVSEGIGDLQIGGRNLRTINNTTVSLATRNEHKYTLTKTSGSGNPYVRVSEEIFEDDTYYIVTFKSKKISGNVKLIGGHSNVAVNSTTEIYLDGKLVTKGGSGWSNNDSESTYPNDTKEHHHEIRFKTVKDVSGEGNARWYIQPNRGDYGDNFKIEIWDWQVEKGNKATGYSIAPEDQVNKTNVLSSINLSPEGVKIQGDKIDIKGLVEFINKDGSSSTMIDGGKIVSGSITANELNVNKIFGDSIVISTIQAGAIRTAELDANNIKTGTLNANRIGAKSITVGKLDVNNIFGNSAVIAKIQADSVKTAELSATRITSGTLDAGKVSVKNLSASSITTGTLDGKKATIKNISASNVTSGTLNASDVVIHGGNSNNYTEIKGAQLTVRGTFKQTWKGKTNTYDIKSMLQNGYLRFRNDSEKSSLYYSWYGISTYVDGDGDYLESNGSSGTLRWWDYTYSDNNRGITMHSHAGKPALVSNLNHVVIQPMADRSSKLFYFTKSADGDDGYLMFSRLSGGTTSGSRRGGLRFVNDKDGLIQVVDAENTTGGSTEIEAGTGTFNIVRRRAGTNYLSLQNENYFRVGLDADGSARVVSDVVRRRTYSSSANVHVTSEGTLGRSTSSERYKVNIEKQFNNEDEQLEHSKKILNLSIKKWNDKFEVETLCKENEAGKRLSADNFKLDKYVGLTSEDVQAVGLGEHVEKSEEGLEGIEYDRLWIHLIPIVKEQEKEIEEQKQENEQLKSRLELLEQQVQQLLA